MIRRKEWVSEAELLNDLLPSGLRSTILQLQGLRDRSQRQMNAYISLVKRIHRLQAEGIMPPRDAKNFVATTIYIMRDCVMEDEEALRRILDELNSYDIEAEES